MDPNSPGSFCILPKRSHIGGFPDVEFHLPSNQISDSDFLHNDSIYLSFKKKKLPQEVDEDNIITIRSNENKEENQVKPEKFFKVDVNSKMKIGRGAYGEVFQIKDKNNENVALKEIPLTLQNLKEILIESALHQKLNHINIVKFLHAENEEPRQRYCIYLEYVPFSLTRFLSEQDFRRDERYVIFFLRQLIDGVAYLHSVEVIHCDLKCDNILVDVDETLKICDFGCAHNLREGNAMKFQGTPNFAAPEVCNPPKTGFSKPADVWSIGCTCLEMLTGFAPFFQHDSLAIIFQMAMGILKIEDHIKEEFSEGFKQFLLCCWERESSKRPTIEQLTKFPVLSGGKLSSEDSDDLCYQSKEDGEDLGLLLRPLDIEQEDFGKPSYPIDCSEILYEPENNVAFQKTSVADEMQSSFVGYALSIHTDKLSREEKDIEEEDEDKEGGEEEGELI